MSIFVIGEFLSYYYYYYWQFEFEEIVHVIDHVLNFELIKASSWIVAHPQLHWPITSICNQYNSLLILDTSMEAGVGSFRSCSNLVCIYIKNLSHEFFSLPKREEHFVSISHLSKRIEYYLRDRPVTEMFFSLPKRDEHFVSVSYFCSIFEW